MRFGLPRTYAPYATTPWGAVRAKLDALLGGPAARQRQQQPVRTDGPMVGREARWLGDDLLPIPVGTMGTVTGWKPVNGQFVLPVGGQMLSPLAARWISPTAAR